MNLEERIAHHASMALSYRDGYVDKTIKEGAKFNWTFSPDCIYFSPYFTGEELNLAEVGSKNGEGASLEAKVYTLTFADWQPEEFKYWPAANGFTMKTRWQGTRPDGGTKMGFYSYSFVETDDEPARSPAGRPTSTTSTAPFLEYAIGVSGPFQGHSEYLDALRARLAGGGLTRMELHDVEDVVGDYSGTAHGGCSTTAR